MLFRSGDRPYEEYDSIPNRIVIAWEGSEADAIGCARDIKAAIETTWFEISSNTRDYFLTSTDEHAHVIWKAQEKTWLECYWVVYPIQDKLSYPDNMALANHAMGSRKLTREFSPTREMGVKDSITGQRGVLRRTKEATRQKAFDFWRERKREQRNRALLSHSERLSAISTIKRFAHEPADNHALQIEHRYPSTSSIAVAPFKYDVLKALYTQEGAEVETLLTALQKFIETLLKCYDESDDIPVDGKRDPARDLFFTRRGNFNPEYFPRINSIDGLHLTRGEASSHADLWATHLMCLDGDYLFEDTLITKTIAEYLPPIDAEEDKLKALEQKRIKELKPKVEQAQKALKAFVKAASALDIAPPHPYLAVLSMDGDKMGRLLSTLFDARQHQTFSEDLAHFARTAVKPIVEDQHLGRVVYAGGDDVLALVAVRDALDVAEDLRRKFPQALEKYPTQKGLPPTMSAGIAFVHHTHDLQQAINAANDAQKKIAKEKLGRAALAVTLLRRSGETRQTGSRWHEEGVTLVAILQVLREAFYHNILARSLPYDVSRIAYQMDGSLVPIEARQAEMRRVVKRRFTKVKEEAIPKMTLRFLSQNPDKHEEDLIECLLSLMKIQQELRYVQQWLEITRFIAQKESDR